MKNKSENNTDITYKIFPVGYIRRNEGIIFIEILPQFMPALRELENFSHVQVIWWFSDFDDENSRKTTTFDKMPFDAPELGVFACRSPKRPNPLGLSTTKIINIDHHTGLIEVANIDAYDGTPVIDLKAYVPFCDRVKNVKVAKWAQLWPEWLPENGLGLENE